MPSSGPKHALNEPLRFTPYFRPQVWGGRQLKQRLNKPSPPDIEIGEAWELSAQPLHVSRVQAGPWNGVALTELWSDHREELAGRKSCVDQPFPWLIKWLDCSDRFSVQVHPSDRLAREMLGEPFGKTESWVILHAEPDALVYAGLKPGVTRQELADRSKDGSVAECLHRFTPSRGDCVHIPAGTVHAISGGVLLAEVQQSSDATFRLFDWNRVDGQGQPRTLHLEQALSAINFDQGPIVPAAPAPLPIIAAEVSGEMLVRCPCYHLDRFRISRIWTTVHESLTAWIVYEGAIELIAAESRFSHILHAGDVVLIPAAATSITWHSVGRSIATVLRVQLPSSSDS